MKNRALALFVVCSLFSCMRSSAQNMIRQQSCNSEFINNQVDSMKKLFAADGFQVVKEASMTMESEYEMPVIVPLREGSWYRFVFVGDIGSKLYEVRMFDWNEKQVVYQKKMWGEIDGNIINYDYIPRFSEYHMIKPVQVNKKKKSMCGYIMLLRKVKE